MREVYRHGDLLIERTSETIPTTAAVVKTKVLAYGEITGHAHRLNGTAAELLAEGDRMWVRVNAGHGLTPGQSQSVSTRLNDLISTLRADKVTLHASDAGDLTVIGGTITAPGQRDALREAQAVWREHHGTLGALNHEDHGVVVLPIGVYPRVRQREYDPFEQATRMVAD